MPDIHDLSDREREILHLVATGASNKEIAQELYISSNTVKVHLRNIFAKIGVASRTEAAMYAVGAGLIEPISSPQGDGFTVQSGKIDQEDNAQDANLTPATPLRMGLRSYRWLLLLGVLSAFIIVLVAFQMSGGIVRSSQSTNQVQPLTETRWQSLMPMEKPRSRLALASYGDQIYAIGGTTPDGFSKSVERFDPEQNTWISLASKPTAVADIQAAVIGGRIYVPGGRDSSGQPLDIFEIYDPGEDLWINGATLPMPVYGYSLVAFEGKLFLFGGTNGIQTLDIVLEYNPDTQNWSFKTPMPFPREFAGAALAGGKIYLMGGQNGNRVNDSVFIYQPDIDNGQNDPWSFGASMPEARARMGVTSLADIIYLVGGTDDSDQTPQPWSLITQTDEWQVIEQPRSGRKWQDLGLVSQGTQLYALGGDLDGMPADENLSYKAIYTFLFPVVP